MVEAMSVKELKAFLSERGVSLVGVTEKSELLALARTAHEQDAKSGIVRHAPASAPALPKGVITVGDKAAWTAIHQRVGSALVVVDFTATWCGPCKQIGPKFHAMADEFTGVVFASVDVDANSEVSQECDVKCMPTFQFFRSGKVRAAARLGTGHPRAGERSKGVRCWRCYADAYAKVVSACDMLRVVCNPSHLLGKSRERHRSAVPICLAARQRVGVLFCSSSRRWRARMRVGYGR